MGSATLPCCKSKMRSMVRVACVLLVSMRASAQSEIPAAPTCVLGQGWSLTQGCSAGSPLEAALPACSSTNVACIETRVTTQGHQYSREVNSRSDYTQLTRVVAEGEGSGWGVHASASVEAMSSGAVSSTSISFVLGESLHVSTIRIRNDQNLRLSQQAKNMLENDPYGFVRIFGLRFVYAFIMGGSYMGVASAWSTSSDTESDLSIVAGLSYRDVFEVSGAFDRAIQQSGSRVETTGDARFRGGADIPFARTPEEMVAAHAVWSRTVRDNPVPLVLYTRPWIGVMEVAEIVATKDAATQRLFQVTQIPESVRDMLSYEHSHLNFVGSSVRQALDWETQSRDFTIRSRHNPSVCMHAVGALQQNSPIRLWTCTAAPSQQFEWYSDFTFRLVSNPSLCFNAYSGMLRPGDQLVLWTCTAVAHERFVRYRDSTIRVASNPGLCLNAWGGSLAHGVDIKLNSCRATPNEQFIHRGHGYASAQPLESVSVAQLGVREFQLTPLHRCQAGGVQRTGYSFDRCSSVCFANPDCSAFEWGRVANQCVHVIGPYDAVCALIPDGVWDHYRKKSMRVLLDELNTEVRAQLVRVDTLDEIDVRELREHVLAGDLSWFKADEFLRRFRSISFQKF